MTENEALKELKLQSMVLEKRVECNREIEEFVSSYILEQRKNAVDIAIQSLEEVQAYRAIGTVEDFKALKEKEEKIKFIINEKHYSDAEECDYGNYYTCENALMIKDIEEILGT